MIEWWYWLVLGLCLLMAELVIPAFFIFWFGIGAIAVALVLLAVPNLGMTTQILLWAVLSSAQVLLWFRFFRPKTMTTIGTSASNVIGEVGVLAGDLGAHSRSCVRFQKPVLGSENWEYYADTDIKAGTRVRIVAVEGNFIKVEENKQCSAAPL